MSQPPENPRQRVDLKLQLACFFACIADAKRLRGLMPLNFVVHLKQDYNEWRKKRISRVCNLLNSKFVVGLGKISWQVQGTSEVHLA
jgi:hypothetical protein